MSEENCSVYVDRKKLFLSIVVPVYNEEDVLNIFYEDLIQVLNSIEITYEINFINDGSSDNSLKLLKNIQAKNKNVFIVNLSRNYGKEIAMTAGMDYADGDAVVIIDADLQDPPILIKDMVEYYFQGFDVVYAKRINRKGETFVKKNTASLFYWIMKKVGKVKIPQNTGDYRLLSKRAVEAVKKFKERHRFMKGLFAWVGFKQKEILFVREARVSGKTKWNYFSLWNLALEGITSFTIAPLKISSYLGLVIALFSFFYGIFVVIRRIIFGDPVQGWASLMVVIIFLGGVQLITLGVIGEYIGRIFNETKQRPLYFIQNIIGKKEKEIL